MKKLSRIELPADEARLTNWLDANKYASDGFPTDKSVWREWWCINEFFQIRNRLDMTADSETFVHLNDKTGAADFLWDEDFLEVTEATTEEDARAIRAFRRTGGVRNLGEDVVLEGRVVPGGRFKGGSFGEEYEKAMASDILRAISRKANKPYAVSSHLLIYPNSNANWAKRKRVTELLNSSDIEIHLCRFS